MPRMAVGPGSWGSAGAPGPPPVPLCPPEGGHSPPSPARGGPGKPWGAGGLGASGESRAWGHGAAFSWTLAGTQGWGGSTRLAAGSMGVTRGRSRRATRWLRATHWPWATFPLIQCLSLCNVLPPCAICSLPVQRCGATCCPHVKPLWDTLSPCDVVGQPCARLSCDAVALPEAPV